MAERGNSVYESAADKQGHILFKYYCEDDQIQGRRPHYHDSIEIIFVIEGRYLLHIGSEERTLTRGGIGFVQPYAVHYYECPEKSSCAYVLVISSRYVLGMEMPGYGFAAYNDYREGFEKIENFLNSAFKECGGSIESADVGEAIKIGFVNYLLGLTSKYYPLEKLERRKNADVFIRVMTYIDEHFCEVITLSSLADRYGYTKSYFSTMFNEFTGMNLREFVNRRRIKEFIKLRSRSTQPVLRLAEQCGFDSYNTFYRALEKYSDC